MQGLQADAQHLGGTGLIISRGLEGGDDQLALRFVDGFRNIPWTLAFLVSVTLSMGLLELASRSIPMGR